MFWYIDYKLIITCPNFDGNSFAPGTSSLNLWTIHRDRASAAVLILPRTCTAEQTKSWPADMKNNALIKDIMAGSLEVPDCMM